VKIGANGPDARITVSFCANAAWFASAQIYP